MRYATLLLLILTASGGWAQDTIRVKKMNAELSKIASSTKNNGKWIFIKPEQKIKSDAFLKNKKALNLSDKSSFKKINATTLKDAYAMEKHQQLHNNIRIVDAITVIYTNNGNVDRVQGDILEDKPEINTFKLSEKEVIVKALEQLPSTEYAWQNQQLEADLKTRTKNPVATNYPQPEKVYFQKDDKLFAGFELRVISNKPYFDYTLILDAENGAILSQLNNVHNCFAGHKHNDIHNHSEEETKDIVTSNFLSKKSNSLIAIDACFSRQLQTSLYGIKTIYAESDILYNDGTSTNLFNLASNCNFINYKVFDYYNGANQEYKSNYIDIQSANTTLYGVQRTEEYFKKFNRSGWDNKSGAISIIQNAEFTRKDKDGKDEKYYDNASFFNGTLKVGNCQGNTRTSNMNLLDDHNAIDIIAHEFTHGVVATESNLTYMGESGALNESFADIFGNLVEFENEGILANSWKLGEDRANSNKTDVGSGYYRDMANPKDKGQPTTINGINWWDPTIIGGDNGSVHTNSGIQNYFFYLLCNGGNGVNDKGSTYQFEGVGIDIAAFLAYNTLKVLTPTSNHIDAKIAWMTVAEIYYGKCSPTFLVVKKAWNAVGVDYGSVVNYCDLSLNTDLNVMNIDKTKNQLSLGGAKTDGTNCETQLTNSGTIPHYVINAEDDIIIYPNTTITAGSKFILQVSDPCEW